MESPSTDQLVRGLIEISASLSSESPLEEQMITLCRNIAAILDCDRSSIYRWDGQRYQGAYSHGIPAHLLVNFQTTAADSMLPLAKSKESFLIVQRAEINRRFAETSHRTAIRSLVLCPISTSEGQPLAILTAGYSERVGHFEETQAQIVVGAAGLVKVALMADNDSKLSRRAIASRRELLLEINRSEEETRRRIRREIHDDSMHRIESLQESLSGLAAVTPEQNIADSLEALVLETGAAAEALSLMLSGLDPKNPQESDLTASLVNTIRHFSIATDWRTEFVNRLKANPPETASRELLQIARQAIGNVELHAEAAAITIEVGSEKYGTRLTVTDNGVGFDPALVPKDRFGLVSMRERSESNGGTFAIVSTLGEGTSVSAWIPNQLN